MVGKHFSNSTCNHVLLTKFSRVKIFRGSSNPNHQKSYSCLFPACGSTFPTPEEAYEHGLSCLWSYRYSSKFKFGRPNRLLHKASDVLGVLGCVALGVCCFPVRIIQEKRKQQAERRFALAGPAELSATENRGYYAGPPDDGLDSEGSTKEQSSAVSEMDSPDIGKRQFHGLHLDALIEMDEGAPRSEMESPTTSSPPRSPRHGNIPTYIEMPIPTCSRQSNLALPSVEVAVSPALSTQGNHPTRQSPLISSPDESGNQAGSPHFASGFVLPQLEATSRFGHPSPEGRLDPFSLNHILAHPLIELPSPELSLGQEQSLISRHQNHCFDNTSPNRGSALYGDNRLAVQHPIEVQPPLLVPGPKYKSGLDFVPTLPSSQIDTAPPRVKLSGSGKAEVISLDPASWQSYRASSELMQASTSHSVTSQSTQNCIFRSHEGGALSPSHGRLRDFDSIHQPIAATSSMIIPPNLPPSNPVYAEQDPDSHSACLQDSHALAERSQLEQTTICEPSYTLHGSQSSDSDGSRLSRIDPRFTPISADVPPLGVVALFNDYQQWLNFTRYSPPTDVTVLSILHSSPENGIDLRSLSRHNQLEPRESMPEDLLGRLKSSTRSSAFIPDYYSGHSTAMAQNSSSAYNDPTPSARNIAAINTSVFPGATSQVTSPEIISSGSSASAKTLVNSPFDLGTGLESWTHDCQYDVSYDINWQEQDTYVENLWHGKLYKKGDSDLINGIGNADLPHGLTGPNVTQIETKLEAAKTLKNQETERQ